MEFSVILDELNHDIQPLRFAAPVTHVYNPLLYARLPHDAYWRRYGNAPKKILLMGMNPGPFGMVQTGIPFGDVVSVREWLDIEEPVGRPDNEHPKRPVKGFDCQRREVSGMRLWGWARERFGAPQQFFKHFFVINYCPLCFMEDSGRNRTPDKLPVAERKPLFVACNSALRKTIQLFQPRAVLGIGAFAEARIRETLRLGDIGCSPLVGRLPHPSPASPLANRGWASLADQVLKDLGLP